MKFQKFDSMFFIGLLMTFGSLITFLILRFEVNLGTQLAFIGGLGIGVLGIWFVIQNAEKMMKQTMEKHFPEKRAKAS